MTYYVFSGNLKGVEVEADFPAHAVEQAVLSYTKRQDVVLGPAIRVSLLPREEHPMDVYFAPPYEEQFPSLFEGELSYAQIPVERI